MDLLSNEVKEKYKIKKTGARDNLNIANQDEMYDVYEIPLELLYYNDQNDRIATWISQYISEHGDGVLKGKKDGEYNNLIHDFIEESNTDAIKITQTNIGIRGQKRPGVVLRDGRIIDGNRRYTCLRNIQFETSEPQYFKAYILRENLSNNEKDIKRLELQLQHGEDKPVEYDPIDRLVGIYNDVYEKQLFTIEEYAKAIKPGVTKRKLNKTIKEIEEAIEAINIMLDFLEFIDKPKQFYIVRTMKLDGPLREMPKMLKKCKNDEEKEDLKNILFSNFILKTDSDMTRYFRKIDEVVKDDKLRDTYIEEQREYTEEVYDLVTDRESLDIEDIKEIREKNEVLKQNMEQSTKRMIEKVGIKKVKNQPLHLLTGALGKLESIDTNIFDKLKTEQKKEILKAISDLDYKINELKDEFDV